MPDLLVGGVLGYLAACAVSWAVGALVGRRAAARERRRAEGAREGPWWSGTTGPSDEERVAEIAAWLDGDERARPPFFYADVRRPIGVAEFVPVACARCKTEFAAPRYAPAECPFCGSHDVRPIDAPQEVDRG